MLSQNQRKFIRSLDQKKNRQEHRLFLVEGDKMVRELLLEQAIKPRQIFGLQSWAAVNREILEPYNGVFQTVTESELESISSLSTPNQVLALAHFPPEQDPAAFLNQLCFYLDGIQDPGNLGSILRIADWFGMPAVFCSPNTVDVFNPKVVQASMGAVFRVYCAEIELEALVKNAPQTPVSGAVMEGEHLFTADLPNAGLIVIGNEGKGISPQNESLLSKRLSIPRDPNGKAESLNAAIAAGIFASWFKR